MADPRDIEMAHQAWDAIYELLPTFEADDQKMILHDTEVYVDPAPSARDLRAVDAPPGALLLGLYTHVKGGKRDTIQIFGNPTRQEAANRGVPVPFIVREVTHHELGHRATFDHSRRDNVVALVGADELLCSGCNPGEPGCGCKSPKQVAAAFARQDAQIGPSQQEPWNETCPVCLIHTRIGEAERLLAGTSAEAAAQHQVPVGLGGTIAGARHLMQEASGVLPVVAAMMLTRSGQVMQLKGSITSARQALGGPGTILGVEDVTRAYAAVHIAWSQAFQLTWSYFAAQRPSVWDG